MQACAAGQRVDFRCGHQALALMVQTELKLDLNRPVFAGGYGCER